MQPSPRSVDRRGFALVEMAMTTALLALLAILLGTTFAVFGRPTLDILARSRVLRESQLAVASLRVDLAGSLPLPAAERGGSTASGRLLDAMIAGSGGQLWLDFDGAGDGGPAVWGAPDHVIIYGLQGRRLVRTDQTAGTAVVVAGDLDDFRVTSQGDDLISLRLEFRFRDTVRTETLLWHRPVTP